MIKIHPVKCEAENEDGDLTFVVDCFDAECFSLEVKTVIDPDNWPCIAAAIGQTLAYMAAGLTVGAPADETAQDPEAAVHPEPLRRAERRTPDPVPEDF